MPTPAEVRLPIVSLFCGAGGLDLGFSRAGFETILALDSNAAAVRTFNLNHTAAVAHVADLAALTPDDLLRQVESTGRIPVGVVGGPPCQGFSVGNVGGSADDARNSLPLVYANIINRLAASFGISFFVFENVLGLLRKRHAERLGAMRSVLADFEIREFQVDAYNYGVPQHRPRLIWVGIRRGAGRIADLELVGGTPGRQTVRQALGCLPDAAFWDRTGCKSEFHVNHWTMRPKSPKFTSGKFNRWRSFRLLEWDQPSPTVAYGHREIHVHPEGKRRLSVLEAMLLQGFPIEYKLFGSLSDQVTQVSNAVPPPLAEAVARAVRACLWGAIHEQL